MRKYYTINIIDTTNSKLLLMQTTKINNLKAFAIIFKIIKVKDSNNRFIETVLKPSTKNDSYVQF